MVYYTPLKYYTSILYILPLNTIYYIIYKLNLPFAQGARAAAQSEKKREQCENVFFSFPFHVSLVK